jgi:Holliday junction resolvase
MPNRNYNRGRALEYRVRDHYRKQGFEVFRMAGSHSQADLICMKGSPGFITKIVQCKGKKSLMTKKEKADFFKYCHNLGAVGILAYYEKRKLMLENYLCATFVKQEPNAPIALNPVS